MKRSRCLLPTLLLCACLAGCSSQPPQPAAPLAGHNGNYETSATISYRDLQAEAVISQGSPSACSVAFSSPPSLANLSFVFRQDTVDVSYLGISYTLDPGTLPGSAVANLAVAAVNTAMQDNGLSVSYEEDVLTLSGMMESGAFTMRLDKESGNLLKLSIPSEDLEIEFLNFRFLD